MSLTDKIAIVNGEKVEKFYSVTFNATERDYVARALMNMPQHLEAIKEVETMVNILRKMGYLSINEEKQKEITDD